MTTLIRDKTHKTESGTPDGIFLLIQDGIKDAADNPSDLRYSRIDPDHDFQVAVGCVNEFGEREIVGVIARAQPVEGCHSWRISSEIDGYSRLIGRRNCMSSVVKGRLHTFYRMGLFSDILQLPKAMVVSGVKGT
jgi:hypothetical protein